MKNDGKRKKWSKERLKSQLALQSMVLPGIIFLIIFSYIPMYGIVIAFKDFKVTSGIFGGEWVGLKYFYQFLTDAQLLNVLKNTLIINFLGLIVGFPAPIILAVLITELRGKKFKKFTQTVSYLPHFLSWVIYGGICLELLSADGVVNRIMNSLHLVDGQVDLMGNPGNFYLIYTICSVIKSVGYGSILYISAITSVDQEMYEAAIIDGANRMQKIWYITLPAIMGTIAIMLIFQISNMLNTGFEQVLIFQNPLNKVASETLDTYVYSIGVGQIRYSYSTAVGLLKSVVAVVLLTAANKGTKALTGKGLF